MGLRWQTVLAGSLLIWLSTAAGLHDLSHLDAEHGSDAAIVHHLDEVHASDCGLWHRGNTDQTRASKAANAFKVLPAPTASTPENNAFPLETALGTGSPRAPPFAS